MNAPLLPALPGYDNPQLIAHGTTALVFRATQTRLNRPVAIKVITADTGSVPVNAARELATTVALSSQPHIVSIIDTGVTDDDRPYIVMEYCEGGSYAQILRHDGLLPVDDVLEVGIKIGEALHAAHQAGIVHRDVKPSNILRSRFGPALTDFGIARAPDELGGTLTREMMTPHHASPEALLHQAQSGISDIYSLASTMWTLLLGHPPFVDPTKPPVDMYAFRDRVLHDTLPPMTRDDVPAWLIGELDRAMSKLPSSRHGSALEFAEALRRGALGLSPQPRPTTQVHVPGMPAQAWPVPDPTPIGMPPAASTSPRDAVPAGPTPRIPSARNPTSAPPSAASAPPSTTPPSTAAPSATPRSKTPPSAVPASATSAGAAGQAARTGSGGQPAQLGASGHPASAADADPGAAHLPPTSARTGVGGSPSAPARTGIDPAASAGVADPVATPFVPDRPEYRPPPRPYQPAPPTRAQPDSDVFRPGPRTEPRPEARPDLDPDDEPDEGGWLGPAADWPSTSDRVATDRASGRTPPGRGAGRTTSDSSSTDLDRPGAAGSGPRPNEPAPGWPAARPGRTAQSRTAQSRTAQDRGEQNRGEQNRAGRDRAEQDWTDQSWVTADPRTGSRFDEQDLLPEPSRHRGTLLAVLVGCAVLAVAGAAVLVLASSSRNPSNEAVATPVVSASPTRFISAQAVGQPRDIRITEDRGTSVTVGWTDPTAGTVTFVVVGTGPGGQKLETKPINRGTTKVTYTSLSPTKNYCFVVGAVYAVDRVALAAEICTKR